MYAIRQIQHVRNHTVVVDLPKDFAPDSVEVIILPAQPPVEPEEAKADEPPASIQRFLTMNTSHFTATQRQAYDRACAVIRQGRRPGEPRLLGIFEGLVQVADDFDAPLADEEAFWGMNTNEHGLSLEK